MDRQLTETIKRRYNRISSVFDWMEHMIKDEWRAKLISRVHGDVLEVGVGTGANLPFYSGDVCLTGIDFSPGMLTYARKRASSLEIPVELLEMNAEEMAFADNSFDYVLATCVFCSVPDPVAGLMEMRRVCKPDGRVLLLEHMRSENPVAGFLMDLFNPLTIRISGANINRKTMENIDKAGFLIEEKIELMGTIMRMLILHPNK